jgi:hypothetical protein
MAFLIDWLRRNNRAKHMFFRLPKKSRDCLPGKVRCADLRCLRRWRNRCLPRQWPVIEFYFIWESTGIGTACRSQNRCLVLPSHRKRAVDRLSGEGDGSDRYETIGRAARPCLQRRISRFSETFGQKISRQRLK